MKRLCLLLIAIVFILSSCNEKLLFTNSEILINNSSDIISSNVNESSAVSFDNESLSESNICEGINSIDWDNIEIIRKAEPEQY